VEWYCRRDPTLKGAQHEIATDWRAGYKKWINGKGAGNSSHDGSPDAPQVLNRMLEAKENPAEPA
jgi:hypothetical protein